MAQGVAQFLHENPLCAGCLKRGCLRGAGSHGSYRSAQRGHGAILGQDEPAAALCRCHGPKNREGGREAGVMGKKGGSETERIQDKGLSTIRGVKESL